MNERTVGAQGNGEKSPRRPVTASSRFLTVFLILSILLVWCIAILAGLAQRNSALRQAEDEAFRMNQIVAEEVRSLFEEAKVYMTLMDIWLQQNPKADPRTDPDFLVLVDNLRKQARIRIDLRLVSEGDGLFYIPSADTTKALSIVSDREYVKAQKDQTTRGFFVAGPVLSRVTKLWGIPVSYPLTRHNAGMAVIFAALELPILNELFEQVRPKPDGAIALIREDGVLLDRVPFDERLMGLSLAGESSWTKHHEGVQYSISPIDHEAKIISFRKIPGLPLTASVAISLNSTLADWRGRMSVWIAVTAAATVIMVLFGVRLRKSWALLSASEDAIRHMAFYDRLTGLPNRRLLEDRLRQLLALMDREGRRLALLFIDLDRFKPVNDSYGHLVGDWLLEQVALRLTACLRTSDTVARIGGDEFVVLLPSLDSPDEAAEVAEKIRRSLEAPFPREEGPPLDISACVGIAVYPEQGRTLRDLILAGDEAMYRAKKAGRNRIETSPGSGPAMEQA
jgi:diguanylate cyclase (GGDEF)-like protein